jgi:hypothetical protein
MTGGRPRRPILLLAVVALLAACNSPTVVSPSASPIATPSPSVNPSPSPSLNPSTSDGPSQTAGSSAAVELCDPTDLSATSGPVGGAAGSRGADIVVTNAGGGACQLSAFPAVGLVDPSGNVLAASRVPTTADGPSISAGGLAGFSVRISNWCDQSAALPLHVVLALATGSLEIGGLSLAAGDLPPCNGPGQPAAVSTTEWAPG